MDNAAKALRIAGAVLLGLMVTSLLLFAFNMWQNYHKANYQSIQNQQITKFNSSFDAYNKKALRGSDLVSLANKVNSTNRSLAGKSSYDTYGITDMNYRFSETGLMPIRVFVSLNTEGDPLSKLPGNTIYFNYYSETLTKYKASTYMALYNKNNNDFPECAENPNYKYFDLDEYIQHVYNNDKLVAEAKANKEELRKDFKSLYFECTGAVFDKQNGRYCRLFYKQVYKMN